MAGKGKGSKPKPTKISTTKVAKKGSKGGY